MKSDEQLAKLNPASWPTVQRRKKIAAERGEPEPADDSSRLAARKRAKRARAAAQLAEHRRRAHVQLIELLNVQKMRLADQHTADVAPLYAERKRIDEKQIERVLTGLKPDEGLETRRRELTDAIQAANKVLADGIAAADVRLEQLERERIEFAKASSVADIERDLFALGDSEKLAQFHELRRSGGKTFSGKSLEDLYREIVNE